MFETSSEVSALAVSTSTRKSSSGSATYGPHVRLCLLHQKSISSFEVSVSEVVACFSSAFEKRVRRLREYIFLVKKKEQDYNVLGYEHVALKRCTNGSVRCFTTAAALLSVSVPVSIFDLFFFRLLRAEFGFIQMTFWSSDL